MNKFWWNQLVQVRQRKTGLGCERPIIPSSGNSDCIQETGKMGIGSMHIHGAPTRVKGCAGCFNIIWMKAFWKLTNIRYYEFQRTPESLSGLSFYFHLSLFCDWMEVVDIEGKGSTNLTAPHFSPQQKWMNKGIESLLTCKTPSYTSSPMSNIALYHRWSLPLRRSQ